MEYGGRGSGFGRARFDFVLILLLEPDPVRADQVRGLLADGEVPSGLLRVGSREEFLASLDRGGFDVILANLDGPDGFDGMTALVLALERYPDVPFLLLADAAREDRAIEALNAGAADYVLRERPARLAPAVRRAAREREIREARAGAEEKARHLALHDTLTGLPNRIHAQRRLEEAVRRSAGTREPLCALVLDLDRFKLINDTLGHPLGDLLLRAVTGRLQKVLRPGDILARLGGDKFLVLLPGIGTTDAVSGIAQALLRCLRPPFQLDHHEIFVTASVGSSIHPDQATDAETLARNAHLAMVGAKSHGCDNHHHFSADLQDDTQDRLVIETQLHHALDRGELHVYYQPQVDLASGRVAGVEALLRWRHPSLGFISPARFIPVAETSGQIVPIGLWVLGSACRQGVAWAASGRPPVRISVNLSPRQFQQADLHAQVAATLDETGFDPRLLDLELTESSDVFSCDRTLETLSSLRRLGVGITIDDFGTGYSSLSYLKRFPIDTLKIDLLFVRDLTSSPGASAISRGIITMAHNLDMNVIAEGVETEEQLAILRQQGCDQIQGYLFSPPVPADALDKMLAEDRRLATAAVEKRP